MVPQTETKSSAGFKAGVKDYRLTYYTPDYVVKEIDPVFVVPTAIFPPGFTLPTDKTPVIKNNGGGSYIDVPFGEVKKVGHVTGSILTRNFLKRPKVSNQVRSFLKIEPVVNYKREVRMKAFGERSSSTDSQVNNDHKIASSTHRTKPPLSIEGIIGFLINKDFYSREHWCSNYLEENLDLISTENKIENRHRIRRELEARSREDYVDIGKTIDLDLYESSYPLRQSKINTPKAALYYNAAVVMFLHVDTGKRLFLQLAGISFYQFDDFMCSAGGTRYIKYNNMLLPFLKFQKQIVEQYPNLKKDYVSNSNGLVFHVIKIGSEWACEEKRTNLVSTLSQHYGSLVYNIDQYTNYNYTERDYLAEKKKCLLQGNSKISLHSQVQIGYSEDLKSNYGNRLYSSILEFSNFTGMSHNEVVYRVSSMEYEGWFLISSRNFDLINSRNITNVDREKIKKIIIHPFLLGLLKIIKALKRCLVSILPKIFVVLSLGLLLAHRTIAMPIPLPPMALNYSIVCPRNTPSHLNHVGLSPLNTDLRGVLRPAGLRPMPIGLYSQINSRLGSSLVRSSQQVVQLTQPELTRARQPSFQNPLNKANLSFDMAPNLPNIWDSPMDGLAWVNLNEPRLNSINGNMEAWLSDIKREAKVRAANPAYQALKAKNELLCEQALTDYNALLPVKDHKERIMTDAEMALRNLLGQNFYLNPFTTKQSSIYAITHIKTLMTYVGQTSDHLVRINGHFSAYKHGNDVSPIMQGLYIQDDATPADFVVTVLRSHIDLTETMTTQERDYATKNNKYPEGWEAILQKVGINTNLVDQSKSFLDFKLLRDIEEQKWIAQWASGFILVDNQITSNVANFKHNPDRSEVKNTQTRAPRGKKYSVSKEAAFNAYSINALNGGQELGPGQETLDEFTRVKVALGKPKSIAQLEQEKTQTTTGLNKSFSLKNVEDVKNVIGYPIKVQYVQTLSLVVAMNNLFPLLPVTPGYISAINKLANPTVLPPGESI